MKKIIFFLLLLGTIIISAFPQGGEPLHIIIGNGTPGSSMDTTHLSERIEALKQIARDSASAAVQRFSDTLAISMSEAATAAKIVMIDADDSLVYMIYNLIDTIAALHAQIAALQYPRAEDTTYYVSVEGSDANDGLSTAKPWRTISKVNATTLHPGNTVKFRRGDTWREQLTISGSGTSGKYINIGAYGTGRKPIINGSDDRSGWADVYNGTNANIWGTVASAPLAEAAYVVINDTLYTRVTNLADLTEANKYWIKTASTPDSIFVWRVTDPDDAIAEVTTRTYGIYASQKAYLNISNIEVRGAVYGVEFDGVVNSHSIVENCKAKYNVLAGFRFADGYAYGTMQNDSASYNGNNFLAWGYQGLTTPRCDSTLMAHNYSGYSVRNYVGGGAGVSDGSGYQFFNSSGVMEYNESDHDNNGFFLDPYTNNNKMVMRYNNIHDCSLTGIGVTDPGATGSIWVYYNLVKNSGSVGYGAFNSEHDLTGLGTIYIYNNTFYNDNSRVAVAQVYNLHGVNHVLKNNIFSYPSAAGAEDNFSCVRVGDTDNFTSNYNHFYHGASNPDYIVRRVNSFYAALTNWQPILSQDANSTEGDPLFNNAGTDFGLQFTSPAYNTGTTITGIPQQDMYGHPIVGTVDKGCIERQ
jgi:hypothetical protein